MKLPTGRPLAGLLSLVLVLLLQACAHPIVGQVQGSGAHTLDAQLQRVSQQPDDAAPRYIFVGAALNAREPVFDADIRLMDRMLAARLGPNYRSVLLSNLNISSGDRELPLASIDQLDETLERLARDKRPQDRFIVLLSSHGAPGLIEVHQPAFYPTARLLSSHKLSAWMDELAPNPTWLIISACYAGSHLPQLYQDHVLTMSAAAANRPSFGCSARGDFSWFVRELVASMGKPLDVEALWSETLKRIAQRESEQKLTNSLPQWRAGNDWKDKLHEDWTHF